MSKKELLKGLYALSDATLTPMDTVLTQMERVLQAGVKIIQFREKYASDEAIESTCKALQALCSRYNALFIIDDRAELVKKIDADGLHVGKDDMEYVEARALLGSEKIIGVSCYGDIERAQKYEALGADYVAFGAMFPSAIKPNAQLVPLDVLHKAKSVLQVPICAIGGIGVSNVKLVADSGIEMFALISAIYHDDKIEHNIEALYQKLG